MYTGYVPLYEIYNDQGQFRTGSYIHSSVLNEPSSMTDEMLESKLQELAQKIEKVVRETPLGQHRQDLLTSLNFQLMDFEKEAAKLPFEQRREDIITLIGKIHLRLNELRDIRKSDSFDDNLIMIISCLLFFIVLLIKFFYINIGGRNGYFSRLC